jgi:hypothetical protein
MKPLILALVLTACGSKEKSIQALRDTVQIIHDTAFERRPPVVTNASARTAQSSVLTRCLAAARFQARSYDETHGAPSALQSEARDANMLSNCRLRPQVYLPELR